METSVFASSTSCLSVVISASGGALAVMKLLPDATRWLSRELSYSHDGAQDAVDLNMWIRSTEGLSEACSSALAIIDGLAKEPCQQTRVGRVTPVTLRERA